MRKSLVSLWALVLAACAPLAAIVAPEEQAAWEAALAADTVESYREFLRLYPNGFYAEMAARELQSELIELAQLAPLRPGTTPTPAPQPY